MPRKAARNIPGTERYRDERRKSGGPRMHGRGWHDHETSKEFQPEVMAGADAVAEVEGGGRKVGLGKSKGKFAPSVGKARRKRTTPVGKGPKKTTRTAKGSRKGAKRTGRAGNPG